MKSSKGSSALGKVSQKNEETTFSLIKALGSRNEDVELLGNYLSGVVPHFTTVHAEPPSLAVALVDTKEDPWIEIPKLAPIQAPVASNNENVPKSSEESPSPKLDSNSANEEIENEPKENSSKEETAEDLLTSLDPTGNKTNEERSATPEEPETVVPEDIEEIVQENETMNSNCQSREIHKGEQLFLRKFAADITTSDYDFLQGTPQAIYNSLPTSSVIPRPFSVLLAHVEGPDDMESEESFLHYACGRTISTYPCLPGHSKREGSPICDAFQYRLYNHRAILAVTDGCNWGMRPHLASRTANKTFVEYLENNQGEIHTVREAGHLLLRATSHAHTAIKEQAKELQMECGSTTLFGGILLELSERVTFDEFEEDAQWVFVCINVGDCKAFCIRVEEREILEIPIGNRTSSMDATDPGGRLGANGKPDLRNLELYCFPCREKDILIVCSDGVFDNLDPQPQGILPRDLGINVDTWEDEVLDPRITASLFLKFRLQFLKTLLFEDEPNAKQLSPQYIVRKLLHNSLITTRQSRKFMREHPGKRLPSNYDKYPGKMDHTTALAVTVGNLSRIVESGSSSESHFSISKNWSQSNERNALFSIDAPGNRTEVKIASLLDIPLSVNIYQNSNEILLICDSPAQSNISVLVDESNVYLRVIPREKLNYNKLLGDVIMFGINELEQPIERAVPLPCEVLPSTKIIETDRRSGCFQIKLQKKQKRDHGTTTEWISI